MKRFYVLAAGLLFSSLCFATFEGAPVKWQNGGTGQSTLGTAGQVLSVATGGTTTSWTTLSAGMSPANWGGTSTLTATNGTTAGVISSGLSGSVTANSNVSNISCSAASGAMGITCTLPSTGFYNVCYAAYCSNSVGADACQAQLVDGSITTIVGAQRGGPGTANDTYPLGGCGNYYAASTTETFQMYGAALGGGTATYNLASMSVTSLANGGNTYGAGYVHASGYWTLSSSSMTDFSGSSTGVTSWFSSNVGTVATSNSYAGINFTPTNTGVYEVCFSSVGYNSAAASPQMNMTDGTNVLAVNAWGGFGANSVFGINLCGMTNITSLASPTVIKMQGYNNSSGTFNLGYTNVGSPFGGNNGFNYTIHQIH